MTKLSVISQCCLNPDAAGESIWHLQLSSKEGLTYQAGDWALVSPRNSQILVKSVMESLGLTRIETIHLKRLGEVSVFDALEQHLELTQLNPAVLNKLQRQLGWHYWANRAEMIEFAQGKDVLDLLCHFEELIELGGELLSYLSPLAPRYYSIASSASVTPHHLDLVYKQVVWQQSGRTRAGVASNYLAQLVEGDQIDVTCLANRAFKLPDNPHIPILMLGAGTGVAPFLGFMAERAMNETENWLINGNRWQATEDLFANQFAEYQQQGRLKLNKVFSRDGDALCYVQEVLLAEQAEVIDWLERGAQVYICGSQTRLGQGVEQALKQIFEIMNWPADDTWQAWRQSGRLQLDVY